MKVAILSSRTCQVAIKTAVLFEERGRSIDLILVETAEPTREARTLRELQKTHRQFEGIVGPDPLRSWKRRVWDGLPARLRRLLRRSSHRVPLLRRISVENYARSRGIELRRVRKHSSREAVDALEEFAIDYALLTSSGRLIREPLLSMPRTKIINAHPAVLPEHRALDAMAWSILDGAPTGLTTHIVDAGIDTGPILDFREVPPRPGDNIITLERRIGAEKPAAFFDMLRRLEAGEIGPSPQVPGDGTHHRPMRLGELLEAERVLQERIAVRVGECGSDGNSRGTDSR